MASSCMDSTKIGNCGWWARTSRTSSMPSLCFKLISAIMTSGLSSLIAVRASRAVSASPQTIRSSSFSMMRRNPWRTIGWSSTINTRLTRRLPVLAPVGDIDDRIHALLAAMSGSSCYGVITLYLKLHGRLPGHGNRRAARLVSRDLKLGTDHVGAVFHDFQAHPRTGWCSAHEPYAVVGDAQRKGLFRGDQRYVHQAGVAVARSIGQRLLGDAIQMARVGFREDKLRTHLWAERHFQPVEIATSCRARATPRLNRPFRFEPVTIRAPRSAPFQSIGSSDQ